MDDPQDPTTFKKSKLDWSEVNREPHASILQWHHRLITLRKGVPALSDMRMEQVHVQFDEEAGWIGVQRGPILILCNFSASKVSMPLPFRGAVLLSSHDSPVSAEGAIGLLPESVLILGDCADNAVQQFLEQSSKGTHSIAI